MNERIDRALSLRERARSKALVRRHIPADGWQPDTRPLKWAVPQHDFSGYWRMRRGGLL